jgi:uncharacterized membrane protein YhaH (DUF805 family)
MGEAAEIIGLLGVVVVLVLYFMIATKRLHAAQLAYPVANIIGTCMILFSLFYAWNLPSLVMQIAWIMVSFIGIIRILKKERQAGRKPS